MSGLLNLDPQALMQAMAFLGTQRGQLPQTVQQVMAMQEAQRRTQLAAEQEKRELERHRLMVEQQQRTMGQEKQIDALAQRAFAPNQNLVTHDDEGNPMPSSGGGGMPEFASGLLRVAPFKAVQFQQALAKDSPYGKIDPKDYTPESFRNFAASGGKDYTQLRPRSKVEVSNGAAYDPYNTPPGSFVTGPQSDVIPDGRGGWMPNPAKVALKRAGASQVTVDNRQENEFNKKIGAKFADNYSDILSGGMAAQGKLRDLQRFESIVAKVPTGKLEPLKAEVGKLAASLGIKVDTEKLGFQEALESLTNQFALTLRNPQGGAGMPGALSDKDRDFLVNMVPGLGKTPGGNQLIIEAFKRVAQREVEISKLARAYKAKTGKFDEGFYEVLAQEFGQTDLLGDLMSVAVQRGASSTPAADTVYRFDKNGRPIN